MTTTAASPANRGRRGDRSLAVVRYGVVIGAVLIAWQVVKAPLEERAPPAMAIRVSPTSPLVLQRAAEAEFAAARYDNARSLAAESLSRDPFSVRALRVLGLTYDRSGDRARADDLVTLAGNWSLRDDPAHAWLVEQRLRRGDFGSAFAHADTLARRRPDLYPQLFELFTTAATQSPNGMSALAGLLSRSPPWRDLFLEHLYSVPEGDQLLGALALSMQAHKGRFSDVELSRLYLDWAHERRVAGLVYLRQNLGRPALTERIQDGDFSGPPPPAPFAWSMDPAPGLIAAVSADGDPDHGNALRVQYSGLASEVVAYQLLLLTPGAYTLQGRFRMDQGVGRLPLAWTVTCLESGQSIASAPIDAPAELNPANWLPFDTTIQVPSAGCSAQWLRLITRPADRRMTLIAWFDDLKMSPRA